MDNLFPEGLTDKEFEALNICAKEASKISLNELLDQAEVYLEKVRIANEQNVFVNIRLAEAIFATINTVFKQWESIPIHARPWCCGMAKYFFTQHDIEDDLISPIGFEDDVEIMNACLCLAGREDLCVNPEDFDDV